MRMRVARFNGIIRIFYKNRNFFQCAQISCARSFQFCTTNSIVVSSPLTKHNLASQSKVAIPFNMRDGIAICVGKGNARWLNTAPHGAGRIMSRAHARKELHLQDFQKTMAGIYSTSICEETIDESPMAYKETEEILELIKPTVDVIAKVTPRRRQRGPERQ